MDLIDDFFALVYVLLIVSVAVGVLGVVGTLLSQVLDRTREIGILRAVGCSRAGIGVLFVGEAAVMGAVGGMLGAAAAQPRPYYGPPPAYVYDEPAYAPRCYYTRGEPVWDSYRGIWVRPRVRVCD